MECTTLALLVSFLMQNNGSAKRKNYSEWLNFKKKKFKITTLVTDYPDKFLNV